MFYCRRLDTLSSSYIYPILESIIINFLITLRLGFNRTFMELKVQFVVSSAEDSMVQSHLYSCESLRVGYGEGKYRCFNRTFMELKERNAFGLTLTPCVSIAPLWN